MIEPIEGGSSLNIQGLDCQLPPPGYIYNRLTKKLEYRGIYQRSNIPEEQYWEIPKVPEWYVDVMKKWDDYDKNKKENDPEFYDERLEDFKKQEWDKRINGSWFMNYNPALKKSEPIYLTGMYYFLLRWWLIDIGHPSFTLPHLKKFYFLQYCIDDPLCFGMIDITKRRFLKTFIGGLFVTERVSRTKYANGGLQSKTGKDCKKLFSKAIVDPFRRLPKFFRPEYDMSLGVNPKTEMRFQKTNIRGKKAEDAASKDELNSVIDWESSEVLSYDGSKLFSYFCDEWGKAEGINVFDRHEVIRFCLLDHEGRVIGKALYSTTVEQVDNESNDIDKSAKQLWDASDQNKRSENGQTESGLYRFFQTADEAKNFDKYGFPDVEKNIKSILADREAAKNNPRQLAARIRKEPRIIEDAFLVSSDKCVFNSVNISNRKMELIRNPVLKRRIIFYKDLEQKTHWRDWTNKDESFYWEVTPDFELSVKEKTFKNDGLLQIAAREHYGAISVDSYSNSQGGRKYGSKASAWIGYRHLLKPVAHLYGRPAVKETLHNQVMLAAEFCGFRAYFEHTADDFYGYFRERGKLGFLGKYPKSLIDPEKLKQAYQSGKPVERFYGVPITPFSLTRQLDNGIAYFEYHCNLIDFESVLDVAPEFDPYDRTKFDTIVSLLILISILIEPAATPEKRKEPLISEYTNPHFAGRQAI